MTRYKEYIEKYPQMTDSVGECPTCGAVCFPCECGCGLLICENGCETKPRREDD